MVPGDSLRLLPTAELPRDLRWTQSNPLVSEAFARAAQVVDEIGLNVVPASVRTMVSAHLGRWNGEHPSLDRAQVVKAVGTLEESERPLATLLLLTALASFQVDERVVCAARASLRDETMRDSHLIGAVAWAAFSAARVVGSRMSLTSRLSMPIPTQPAPTRIHPQRVH